MLSWIQTARRHTALAPNLPVTWFFTAPSGELLFSGGITGSRGHAGQNSGEDAVIALVNGHSLPLTHSHVFGCDLFNPEGKTDQ